MIAVWTFIAILYFVPALKFVFATGRSIATPLTRFTRESRAAVPPPAKTGLGKILRLSADAVATFEFYVNPWRFYVVGGPLFAATAFLWGKCLAMRAWPTDPKTALVLTAFASLAFWERLSRHRSDLRLGEYLREHPRIHPEDFFFLLKRDLAFGVSDLFSRLPGEITTANADFRRQERAKQSSWLLVTCALDTHYITALVTTAAKRLGLHFGAEVGDPAAILWGKRILQRCRMQLVVRGLEKFAGKRGTFLIVSNHKSSMDFVATFFALSETATGERSLKPRFVVAADHFRDNPLLYRILGVGLAIEVLGMVFLDRKNRENSFDNLRKAARDAVTRGIDIAIYPQGTRAVGNFDRAGKRRDAGYYTTVSGTEPAAPLAHLKKGTAHLILDTLKELRDSGKDDDLNLVFLGIQGTANTLPRGSLKIQTETAAIFSVGDVVTLPITLADEVFPPGADDSEASDAARQLFTRRMNELIDAKLAEAMDLHAALKKRFLTDIKGSLRFEQDKIDAITRALDALGRDADVYRIIDRIYSLPITEWNGYLSQLCQLLQGRAEPERFLPILQDVSKKLAA